MAGASWCTTRRPATLSDVTEVLKESLEKARREGLDLGPARKLLEEIIQRWNPLQIWLFGSRARKQSSADSDWDFLVVVPDETRETDLEPAITWEIRVRGGVAADLVPCRASDFSLARDVVNTLSYEATHHGVLTYARA
jgi:predicted nucleotidyltransferase